MQLCGCTLIGAGLWLHLVYKGYATLLPNHAALSADTLFLSVGIFSFVVSFFGYCGSWFQSRCLVFMVSTYVQKQNLSLIQLIFLLQYIALIVLLFLSEFLLGSIAFVFRGGISRILINELRYGIEHHYNATDRGPFPAPSVAAIWDNVQTEVK